MECSRPMWLRQYEMYVPCGRCYMCKSARAREWSLRMMHELDYHESSVFVTLTYDDENLPSDGLVNKVEMQLFMKRVRKHFGGLKIKYYITGEYGDKNGRPHYHGIIFGLGAEHSEVLCEKWNKGFVKVGSVTRASVRYVANYIEKKVYSKTAALKRVQPFSIMSRGIGERFVKDNRERLLKEKCIRVKGNEIGLPKYYYKKLGLTGEDFEEKAEEMKKEREEHFIPKYGEKGAWPAVKSHMRQKERNKLAKDKMREGKL